MTPPVSPIREPFDVPYETGFPLSERFRGFTNIEVAGTIDPKDGNDFTDGLLDTTTVVVTSPNLIRR